MLKKQLVLIAIVCTFWACSLQAQCTKTWVGGEEGNWENPSNWSPWGEPNEANCVSISDASVDVSENHEVGSLTTDGEVELERGVWWHPTITTLNGLTNHGDLGIDEIEIHANVTNTDGALLEGDSLDIEQGDLLNEAGGRIQVGDYINVEEGNIHNSGTIFLTPGDEMWAEYQFQNSGFIEMYDATCASGQAFGNQSTGTIKGFGAIHSDQVIQNQGTIYAYAGSLAVASEGGLVNEGILRNNPLSSLHISPSLHIEPPVDVNNNGTIEVNAGGGVAFDCNLVNEHNGIIKLLGGTLAATTITQRADANFAGFGSITGDVIIDPDGLIKLTGPTNIVGSVTINAGATLEIRDGQTMITGHTTCDGTIHLIGGTVIFQGGCDCDGCNIINEAGTDRNHFDINADGIEDFKDFAEFANNWLWQATWY
jgi:hypothetical protein